MHKIRIRGQKLVGGKDRVRISCENKAMVKTQHLWELRRSQNWARKQGYSQYWVRQLRQDIITKIRVGTWSWLQVLTSCLASASTRSSSDVCSLLGRGWYSRPKPSSVAEEVGAEWKAVASGEGRLDTGGRTMEKDGDIRGEWSNDFLLAMMQLFQW